MKFDTYKEWSEMSSTACGFVAGLIYCKYNSPTWFVTGAMAVVWIGCSYRAVYCKHRDLRTKNEPLAGV